MKLLNTTSEIVKELLWPTRCAVCDAPGSVLCEKCRQNLRYIDTNKACKRCGAFGGYLQCSECNEIILELNGANTFPFDELRHCVIFNEDARRIITTFKDGTELRLSHAIASIMAEYLQPSWVYKKPIITFIPPTKEALARRGFNHTEMLAKELSCITGIEVKSLFSTPKSIDQRALSRKERISNMSGIFKVNKNANGTSINSVILIDDVCTTGATMYSASLALQTFGVSNVYGLTFARVMS